MLVAGSKVRMEIEFGSTFWISFDPESVNVLANGAAEDW